MTEGQAVFPQQPESDVQTLADQVVATLWSLRAEDELPKVRKRLAPDEEAFGLRMRDLFDTAKAHVDLPLEVVDRLLDHPAYEPRMAAMCVLDFRARRRLSEDARAALADLYLGRHDRITTWDMVDRAAPYVIGRHLTGRSWAPLHALAESPDPLRRRTAITAPLYFVRAGTADDIAGGFTLAARLATDPEPVAHQAVGTFLKHAGGRDPDALDRFLTEHGPAMPRAALRLATAKLPADQRARYRG